MELSTVVSIVIGAVIGVLLVIEQRTAKARKQAREIKRLKKTSLTFRENTPQRVDIDVVTTKGYERISIDMSMDRFVMHLKALSKMHKH